MAYTRSSGKAAGKPISESQQILTELEHPEIEEKRKKAISTSPKIRERDFCTHESLPRTWVQFKKGADKEKSMQNLIEAINHKPYGEVMKSIHVT